MSNPNSPYHKHNLYLEYHKPGRTFHDKVQFYEQYIANDQYLSFEDKCELRLDYQIALFEIGRYFRYLSKVDEVIEMVIVENIYEFNGKDVFEDLLFKKAACFFNLGKYEESATLLKEMKKISPQQKIYQILLMKCYRKMRNEQSDILQAIGTVALLCAVSLMVGQIIVVAPFYEAYSNSYQNISISLAILGIVIVTFNEIWQWYKILKQ